MEPNQLTPKQVRIYPKQQNIAQPLLSRDKRIEMEQTRIQRCATTSGVSQGFATI